MRTRTVGMALLMAMAITLVGWGPILAQGVEERQEGEGPPETGTDPRDFANKFMPYYRYTELENGLQQKEFVLFGLIALSPKIAFTYEVPLGYERDISGTSLFNPVDGMCGTQALPLDLPPGMPVLPGGLPSGALEGDCEETGIGDMNIRLIFKNGHGMGGDWLTGVQVNLPTASEDVLGAETFSIAPMLTYVRDLKAWPGPGAFFAMMNFYQFDLFKEAKRPDQSIYIGRWFFMLPISKKFKLYLLPELQPIYDFEASEFSFWIGPELGKMVAPGNLLYVKPGWGVDVKSGSSERDFTFEVGWRIFLD